MQEQSAEFGRQMMEQRVREDKRMEFVERHIAGLQSQGQQGVPAAPVPPSQGTDDIRAAVRETAEQIHGKNAEMFGQFTQGVAGQLGEAIRNMQTQSCQNMESMYSLLHQNQNEHAFLLLLFYLKK